LVILRNLVVSKEQDKNTLILDHIVYTVFDLDLAINYLEIRLGVRATFGGYHKTEGTKNALIRLGSTAYLELLAIDDQNKRIPPPRWMGVDVLQEEQITRWALKSNALDSEINILRTYNPEMGIQKDGSRNTEMGKTLQWKLSKPLAFPEVEIVPFLIDWNASETHPAAQLPDMGCKLLKLQATHPNPAQFDSLFHKLNYSLAISKSKTTTLTATIQCPKGIISL